MEARLFQFIKYKTMTREEARTFLSGTKVYVEGKSKEIQEKLFSIGYDWIDKRKQVQYEGKPFLFIRKDSLISHSDDVVYFKKESTERELSADEIISIEVTEPYRPFKTQEECWNEMLEHQPFGWVKSKKSERHFSIGSVLWNNDFNDVFVTFAFDGMLGRSSKSVFEDFTFDDGTPFGINEE